jgi:hypothetical protein
MKTKIVSFILISLIMLVETSCFIRVRAKVPRPRARVKVRVYTPPSDTLQQVNAFAPFDSPDNF